MVHDRIRNRDIRNELHISVLSINKRKKEKILKLKEQVELVSDERLSKQAPKHKARV